MAIMSSAPSRSAHDVRPVQVAVASFVGTVVEWYDYFIYGLAAAVIFGPQFFPISPRRQALSRLSPPTRWVPRASARRNRHGSLRRPVRSQAVHGGSEYEARVLLALRDGPTVAGLLGELGEARTDRARTAFTSVGTCSISDRLTDLLALAVLTAPSREGAAA